MNYNIYFENVPTCDAYELAEMLELEYGLEHERCFSVINDYICYFYTFTESDMIDFIENQWSGSEFYRTCINAIVDSIHKGYLPESFQVRF